jgi:hypothetical protein
VPFRIAVCAFQNEQTSRRCTLPTPSSLLLLLLLRSQVKLLFVILHSKINSDGDYQIVHSFGQQR